MPIAAKRGGKITDSHSTLTETAAEVAHEAIKMDAVTKLSLGIIKHTPGGRRDIKFLPITGGIKAVMRGNGAVQELYIYTSLVNEVKNSLTKSFRK